MNSLDKYQCICFIILSISTSLLFADVCPTPEKIKERNISRDYDWTINERRTLEDVLSVEKLYSVRINNKAEYIACYYSGSRSLLRLDGKPLKQPCRVKVISGRWELTENDEQICLEDDLGKCEYGMTCDDDKDPVQ
ncbi:MAG: hypothetical protein DHS20C09_08050 [marine bacterium B5-7]|nr:MAG: hypothetical protein DHS20C09_08050 [marine bacterium B5-7]